MTDKNDRSKLIHAMAKQRPGYGCPALKRNRPTQAQLVEQRNDQLEQISHRVNGGTRSFAEGGPIDPLGTDYDAINAEKTARWAAEDAARRGVRGPATGYQSYSGAPRLSQTPLAKLAAQPTGVQPTTFQQDSDARQANITSLSNSLKAMESYGRRNSLMGSLSSIDRPSLGFAGGGKIDADELMRQMTAKYGAPSAGPTQQPAPQPVQQPKQQPEAQRQPSGIVGVLKGRQQQIDDAERKAVGYKNGKSPERSGFKIKGPGTPTSDSIPAQVKETGEPIDVSTEERIVSKAQDQVLEKLAKGLGFNSLDQLLEAGTGKPVGPTIKRGIAAAAFGKQPENEAQPVQENSAGIAQLGANQPIRTQDVLPGGYMDQGQGIIGSRNKGGQLNVTNVGTQGIADPGKRIVDGSESALIDQKNSTYNPAAQLARMQRLRLESDANDPSITDPTVRDNARQQLNDGAARAAKQGEAYTRSLSNQLTQAKIIGESQVAGLQTQYLNERDPARRNEIAQQIRAIGGKGDNGPSLGQQSNNLEIDAARKAIAGLTPEDIKRRTANYTATGRENPDFDPTLAHQMKLANSRKVGADDHFDQRLREQPMHSTDGDTMTRFRADQSMKGHTLGKQTPNGVEVMDASGKVIGYYR